jgi:hypothetical protein
MIRLFLLLIMTLFPQSGQVISHEPKAQGREPAVHRSGKSDTLRS